jgi:hypothetical protein
MRRSALVIWIVTAVFAIAAVTLALLLLVPAMKSLRSAENRSRDAAAALARIEATAVGDKFEADLRQFAARRNEKSAEVTNARGRLVGQRLDAPFREMTMEKGASRPTAQEFQRAFAFHGDQLKSAIRDLVGRAGGPEVRDIPLMQPPFASGPAPDDDAMRKWQRLRNIETKCLELAAKSGAPPASAMTVEAEPPPPDDADTGYERLRIGLQLLVPEGKTSGVAHGLLSLFDDHGVITKLVGLREAPMPEAALKGKSAVPAMHVSISLSMGFPTPVVESAP